MKVKIDTREKDIKYIEAMQKKYNAVIDTCSVGDVIRGDICIENKRNLDGFDKKNPLLLQELDNMAQSNYRCFLIWQCQPKAFHNIPWIGNLKPYPKRAAIAQKEYETHWKYLANRCQENGVFFIKTDTLSQTLKATEKIFNGYYDYKPYLNKKSIHYNIPKDQYVRASMLASLPGMIEQDALNIVTMYDWNLSFSVNSTYEILNEYFGMTADKMPKKKVLQFIFWMYFVEVRDLDLGYKLSLCDGVTGVKAREIESEYWRIMAGFPEDLHHPPMIIESANSVYGLKKDGSEKEVVGNIRKFFKG